MRRQIDMSCLNLICKVPPRRSIRNTSRCASPGRARGSAKAGMLCKDANSGSQAEGIPSTSDHLSRIQRFKGDPYAIGLAQGRALAARLEQNVSHYIECRKHAVDMKKLAQGALPWLRRLPRRFQDELEGMAEGANIPLQHL